MEIERKFIIKKLPFPLEGYKKRVIEQAYLCTSPTVRVRRDNDDYYLTYKGKGFIVREEYNLPLTRESYEHLLAKADGIIITKTRYEIPAENNLIIELDIFDGEYKGLMLAEVEFAAEEDAVSYIPPEWFGEDVSERAEFCNSYLSAHCYRDIPL